MAHTDQNGPGSSDGQSPPFPQSPRLAAGDKPPTLSKSFVCIWLLVLTASALYLRVAGVSHYYYNSDDLLHLEMAKGHDLSEVLRFSLHETHPPLGNIVRHYWLMISQDPWFVRSMALFFGMLLIPLYYAIGAYLGGRFTGLCLAASTAFSYGCIIQSYVVRNYTLFLLLLSISLFFYLQWRDRRTNKLFAGYFGFALLACLTHFSGIFAIAAIGFYEFIGLIRRKGPRRTLVTWIIAHTILAAIMGVIQWRWLQSMPGFGSFYKNAFHTPLVDLLICGVFYPLLTANYILPSPPILFLFGGLAAFACMRDRRIGSFLLLTGVATAIGSLLVMSYVYTYMGTRRSLWIAPFYMIAVGWTFAECGIWAALAWQKRFPAPWLGIFAVILLVGGTLTFHPQDRKSMNYSDTRLYFEYTFTNEEYQDFTRYIDSLDSRTLLFLGRAGIFFFATPEFNPYTAFDPVEWTDMSNPIAYHNLHLIFYRSYAHPSTFMPLMDDLHTKRAMENADTIAFVLTTEEETDPVLDMMTCPALDKKLVRFPPLPPGHVADRADIVNADATVMLVSKKVLFDDFVSPTGKAHACMKDHFGNVLLK